MSQNTMKIAAFIQFVPLTKFTLSIFAPSIMAGYVSRSIAAALALVAVMASPVAFAGPNQAPVAALTAPAVGTKYNAPATVLLAATASDPDGSVARVDFFSGSGRTAVLIGSASAPPYTATWNNVPAGTYSLTATAIDNLGKVGDSAAVTITVTAVTTVITTPAANAIVAAMPFGSANESGVAVTGTFVGPIDTTVIVTAGGGHSKLATVTGNTFTANVVVVPGPNTIEVGLARRDGTSDLASRTFTAVLPPLVVLTSPIQCAPLPVPANITFAADALSPGGAITKVEFSDQGVIVGTVTGPPYTYTHTLTQVGSRSLAATATDTTGQTANSAVTVSCTSAPPTVALTSPAPGSVIRAGAPIAFTATAATTAAGGSIATVEFLINGSVVANDTTAPYSASVNASGSGTQSLSARAIDNLGVAATSAPVSISVTANASPAVTLDQPTAGQSVTAGSMVNLAASASDSDGSIAKVEFFAGGVLIATDTSAPYTATWTASGTGSVTLTARATDNDGATTTTAGTAIMVTAVVIPPVAITAPANNAVITATPLTVSIHAVAASGATLTKLELFDGMTLVTSVNTPAVNVIDFNYLWSNLPTGMHTLTAKSTDSNGLVSTSAIVNITVPIPPTIALSTLSNYFIAPAGIDLIAETTVAPGATIVKVEFFSGATLVGTVMTPPYTFRLANTAAGSYSFTAKVTDSQGAVVTSNAVGAVVSSEVTLTLVAGLNGSSVNNDDSVFVTGSVQAPPNSAVLVNGQLSTLTGNGQFFANAVPLVEGANTVTATVTAPDGETATQSASVTRTVNGGLPTAGGDPTPVDFKVSVSPDEGILAPSNPLPVSVTIESPANKPFASITLSCGAPNPGTSAGLGTYQCGYSQPGTYTIVVAVKDAMGVVIHSKTNVVTLVSGEMQDQKIRGVFNSMLDVLRAGNVSGANNRMTGGAAERLSSLFSALQAEGKLASAVDQLGKLRGATVGIDLAELIVSRETSQGTTAFPIWMLRGPDGIWRIEGM